MLHQSIKKKDTNVVDAKVQKSVPFVHEHINTKLNLRYTVFCRSNFSLELQYTNFIDAYFLCIGMTP